MADRLSRLCRCVALTVLLLGCASSPHLGASCTLAPSRATWTTTAKAGRIEGEARDLAEKTPIGNLEIRLVDLDRRQRTNAQGAFSFDSIPEGRHVLVTAGSVYQTRGDTLVVVPHSGLRGSLALTTRRDVLSHCPIYHP